jgi:hypothetical protein
MAILGSRVARSDVEIKGASKTTTAEIKRTITKRIKKEAFIYSLAFPSSPFAKCSETKLTDPEEIPISARDERIITRFKAAENTPKSAMEKARATIRVNKNPRKAEKALPTNNINVSFAVELKAKALSES